MRESENELILRIKTSTFFYRHPLTTTSPVSLIVPPPTAIMGLLAAILGKGANDIKENRKIIKNEIQDKIEKLQIYITDDSIKKIKESAILRFNVDETKQKDRWSTPMTTTFMLETEVWVEIYFKDRKLQEELKSSIQNYVSKFTPYLGSSSDLIQTIEVKTREELDNNKVNLWSLEPKEIKGINEGDEIKPIGKIPWEYDDEGLWLLKEAILRRSRLILTN